MNRLLTPVDKASVSYNLQQVIIPPIQDSFVDDTTLEPQMIRIRQENNAYTYLDFGGIQQSPNGTFLLTSNNSSLFQNKVKRFAWVGSQWDFLIPNINQRNNQFNFTVTGSDLYTATMFEGFYNDPTAAVTALVAALNAAPGSPITFAPPVAIANSVFYILTASGPFSFRPSSGVTKGIYLFGIQPFTPLNPTLIIGPVELFYTRYVTINSAALTQFIKNPNSGINMNSSTNLFRFYLSQPYYNTLDFYEGNLRWMNIDPYYTIQTVDLQMLDEWGDPIYIPVYRNGMLNTTLILITET